MNFWGRFTFTILILGILILSSCVTDVGSVKNRSFVKDYSVTKNQNGCGTNSFLILSKSSCASSCSSGTHLASQSEITTLKPTLTDDQKIYVENSSKICIDDSAIPTRPTLAIDIKSDFCSCINGKSDIINDCDSYCAGVTNNATPTLYVNTIMGTDIALNTKLGNLYNWCNAQLDTDASAPGCNLVATDGTSTYTFPVNISPNSNSFSAQITNLPIDKTFLVKIVETKSGSMAQSKEFQIRRKKQTLSDPNAVGALKVTPVNQYTCLTFGGKVDPSGNILRTTYARIFYYFAANETPPPMPPAGGNNQSTVVCHDEELHPGKDSAEYPRLELIPQHLAMWDKTDSRFVSSDGSSTGMAINKTIKTRLFDEYQVSYDTIDLFKLISYPNRPNTTTTSATTGNIPLGYIMVPFANAAGKTFCPTQTDFNGPSPLYNILKDYMDDTEGVYLAEKEAEVVEDNNTYRILYGTMFITESILKKYAFYIENGLKVKADQNSMNTKTIYYYWPVSDTMDPLLQGNRRLYTVRTPDTLNGSVPTGQSTSQRTSDKRIGCIPKSK